MYLYGRCRSDEDYTGEVWLKIEMTPNTMPELFSMMGLLKWLILSGPPDLPAPTGIVFDQAKSFYFDFGVLDGVSPQIRRQVVEDDFTELTVEGCGDPIDHNKFDTSYTDVFQLTAEINGVSFSCRDSGDVSYRFWMPEWKMWRQAWRFPVTINSETASLMAVGIHRSKAYDRLPILADAILEVSPDHWLARCCQWNNKYWSDEVESLRRDLINSPAFLSLAGLPYGERDGAEQPQTVDPYGSPDLSESQPG